MSRNLLSEIPSLKVYSDQGVFATLDTVIIDLYPNGSDIIEPLDSNVCLELNGLGIFHFDLGNITTKPATLTEYLWQMSDLTTKKQSGLIRFGGWVEELQQLGAADTCKVTVNLYDTDGVCTIDINELMKDNNGNKITITGSWFANSRYFRTNEALKPSFDSLTGQAYWILPQLSLANIALETFGIAEKAKQVPAQSTIDLNAWINL